MADLASLVIGLRADVATLQSDLGKANALNQRYAKSASDTWTQSAADIGRAIGAAAVAFAGVAAALGKQAIDTADQFNKMSQKVGVSVETLSALSVQAKLSDVDMSSLGAAMGKLAKSAAAAASGSKEQAQAFKEIGVKVDDAYHHLKPMDQLLAEVATKFATFKDSGEKSAEAVKIFGKAGQDLIPMLNELGTKGLEQVIKNAKEFGAVISTETAQAAEHFNDNLTLLNIEVHGFANAVAAQLLPNLNQLTDDMVNAGKSTDSYKESAGGVADVLKGIVFGLIAVKEFLSAAATLTFAFYDAVKTTFTAAAQVVGVFAASAYKQIKGAFSLDPKAVQDARDELATNLAGIAAGVSKSFAGIKFALAEGVGGSIDNAKTAFNDLFGEVKKGSGAAATDLGKLPPKLQENADAANKAAKQNILLKNAFEDLAKSLKSISAAFDKLNGLNKSYTDQIADITEKMSGADDAQIQYEKNLRDISEVQAELQKTGMSAAEAIQVTAEATSNAQTLMKDTRGWEAQQKAAEAMRAELEKSQKMWGDFADAVFDAVTKSGNFLKNLLENLKQVVTQMLKEWFRTSVIGYFTGAGGGGFGSLASLGMAALGGGGSSGGGIAGGLTSAGGAAATQGGLFGTAQGGQSLFSGVQTIFGAGSSQTITGSLFGSGEFDSGFGTAAAPYIGAAAGIYAGYNRYQQSNGGVAGIAGAAAYGYGTYAATIGTSAALGGGLSAGVAAIPVVGWIALAAMLIDHFSGGKLFGTKGEVKSGVSTLSVDAAGASYSTFLALKGQGSLFSGAQWSTKNIAQTPEEAAAAKAFYDSMVNTMGQYAAQFGVKAGDLVSAQFGQQFDKHGNPTGITSATIGANTYQNLKPEQFQAAYLAANELAVLDQFDSKLEETIATFRESADQLVSIADGLSVAQGYFQAGGSFIGTTDETLSGVVKLAEQMNMAGEAIGDTIKRLIQAQAAYDQFVAQFKPPVNYVDDFEAALSGIRTQLLANIKTANDLAKAAGAAGASEKDLANITQAAAHQMAAAVAALEQSAQALAFSMGLSNVGTIDQINAEIQRLQEKAATGANAVHDFGSAINDAAQRATDAINLLLGDLSPLNDQSKLQVALEGLRKGTVSPEQVLEIGRRLYATSQAYTDLFNMVQHMGRGLQAATAGGGAGAASGTGGGLSGSEQQRLSDLLQQKSELQAAADLQNAQLLAQQLAEISAATGDTIDEVIAQRHIDEAGLEARLHMSDDAFHSYIASIQAQQDDNDENTLSIVDVLNKILIALGGTPDAPASGDGTAPPTAPTGHGGHARPGADTAAIVDAISSGFDRVRWSGPRSTR